MIIFDTETTGLIGPDTLPLDQQPEIIEISALKLTNDMSMEETDRIDFLIRPSRLPLPEVTTKINGITTAMVEQQPTFPRFLAQLEGFFLGEHTCFAHNCAYDIGMLTLELRRLSRVNKFPWPFNQHCTVDLTRHLKGYRLKLGELYTLATGKTIQGAHRSMADTEALVEVVRWMRVQEMV